MVGDVVKLTWKPFTPRGPGLPAGPIPPCWKQTLSWRVHSSTTNWILLMFQKSRTKSVKYDSLCRAVWDRSVLIPMLLYLFLLAAGSDLYTKTSLFMNSSLMNTCSHHRPFITDSASASHWISCSRISLTSKGRSLFSCYSSFISCCYALWSFKMGSLLFFCSHDAFKYPRWLLEQCTLKC